MPEVRIGRISSAGRVPLEFTNKMIFFPSLIEFIEEINSQESAAETKLIDFVMMKSDEDEIDDNLTGWEIVSVNEKLIEVDLNFRDPLLVSQGDAYDRLVVQIALSMYPDENQNRLPVSVNRIKDIPR